MAANDPTTIFVTGPSGFVGRHVLAANADGLALRPLSVRAGDPLAQRLAAAGPTAGAAILHLAGRAHRLDEAGRDLTETYRRDNARLTLDLAEAAVAAGARRFVFVSTIHVLGHETTSRPFRPDDPPHPASLYARTKLEAEEGLKEIAARTGLDVVVVRPPLVHGAGAKGNLARLLRAIERGLPLPFAGIDNRRAMVDARCLADLLLLAARHPQAPGRILLPADARPVSTPELVRLLATAAGRRARLFRLPGFAQARRLPTVGPQIASLVDSLEVDTAAAEALGWAPAAGPEAGLHAFVASRARG